MYKGQKFRNFVDGSDNCRILYKKPMNTYIFCQSGSTKGHPYIRSNPSWHGAVWMPNTENTGNTIQEIQNDVIH